MKNSEAVQRVLVIQADRGETLPETLKYLGIVQSSFYRWKKKPDGKLQDKMIKKLSPESSQSKPLDVDSIEKPKQEKKVTPYTPSSPSKDSDSGISAKDIKGRSFNSAMHVTDENERPVIKNGNLIIKPRQKNIDIQDDLRAEKEQKDEEKRVCEEERQAVLEEQEKERKERESVTLKAESVATLSAFAFFKGGGAFFGKKFRPDKEEKREVEQALQKYWEAKGAPDIPPSLELLTVLGMYTAKKVAAGPAEPNTLFAKFKGWIAKRKMRKHKAGLSAVQDEIKKEMGENENDREAKETDPFSLSGGLQNGSVLN
jgi:hypothetical protein